MCCTLSVASSSISMELPSFLNGDRVADVYLNAALPVLLLSFVLVVITRVHALHTRRVPTGMTFVFGCSYTTCSLLLAASYVAQLVLDPDSMSQDVPVGVVSPRGMRRFYVACIACGVSAWLACGCLALAEAWAGQYVGRSMRLWFMLAAIHACFRFASDVDRFSRMTIDPPYILVVVRLAAFAMALGLGIVALCQPDAPSGGPCGRNHCFLLMTQRRVHVSLISRLLSGGGPADGLGSQMDAVELDPMGVCNTEATASYWSRFTFSWLSGILRLGSRRALEQSDLYRLQVRSYMPVLSVSVYVTHSRRTNPQYVLVAALFLVDHALHLSSYHITVGIP